MKILRTLSLLLGALSCAAGLFAHHHDELSYIPEPVVRKFDDKTTGARVTVTWTYLGQEGTWPNVADRYRCDIHQDAVSTSPNGYSLYNLQIQGRRWTTQVHIVSGSQVVFTAGSAAAVTTGTWPGSKAYTQLPIVAKGGWNPNATDKLDDDRVAFIKFAGTDCTLEVLSQRRRHSPKMPLILTSHDTTPPPPDGGGEN